MIDPRIRAVQDDAHMTSPRPSGGLRTTPSARPHVAPDNSAANRDVDWMYRRPCTTTGTSRLETRKRSVTGCTLGALAHIAVHTRQTLKMAPPGHTTARTH